MFTANWLKTKKKITVKIKKNHFNERKDDRFEYIILKRKTKIENQKKKKNLKK
jgi:ribosomal protein S10